LASLTLVLPSFTTTQPGPQFSPGQLTFAAVASLLVYLMFVFTQTVQTTSAGLLVVALISVVGLAKVESPSIEDAVAAVGFPHAFVGVVIALLVLLPESISAVRSAPRQRVQTSLNLAYGSSMASIGLTIPTIAVATIWLDDPLTLGLGETQIVLLMMSVIVGVLTVVPGRAKPLNGGLHLAILAAYMFLSIKP
jgi:Ca2+:H+ antiporter